MKDVSDATTKLVEYLLAIFVNLHPLINIMISNHVENDISMAHVE